MYLREIKRTFSHETLSPSGSTPRIKHYYYTPCTKIRHCETKNPSPNGAIPTKEQ